MKTLKQVFKTLAGAQKRCAFENTMATADARRDHPNWRYHFAIVGTSGHYQLQKWHTSCHKDLT